MKKISLLLLLILILSQNSFSIYTGKTDKVWNKNTDNFCVFPSLDYYKSVFGGGTIVYVSGLWQLNGDSLQPSEIVNPDSYWILNGDTLEPKN